MASLDTSMDLRKYDKDIVLNVKINITKELRIRTFIAMRLIRLAAWVLGCGIKID